LKGKTAFFGIGAASVNRRRHARITPAIMEMMPVTKERERSEQQREADKNESHSLSSEQ